MTCHKGFVWAEVVVDGAGAHAADEWGDLRSLHAASRALERAVSAWCG